MEIILNKREEDIMYILWDLKNAYVQEIINEMPEPKPHYNTVSSAVRKLEKEGIVGYKTEGRAHRYYPIAKKKAYRSDLFDHLYSKYFGKKKKFIQYAVEKLNLEDKVKIK